MKMMDTIWAEHNGPPTIVYKTEEVVNIKNEHMRKIISAEDTLIPPKILKQK